MYIYIRLRMIYRLLYHTCIWYRDIRHERSKARCTIHCLRAIVYFPYLRRETVERYHMNITHFDNCIFSIVFHENGFTRLSVRQGLETNDTDLKNNNTIVVF